MHIAHYDSMIIACISIKLREGTFFSAPKFGQARPPRNQLSTFYRSMIRFTASSKINRDSTQLLIIKVSLI